MATLYRKYRSQRFDDVIGQAPIITTLTNQIKLNRINHAYLFTGSRGIGKTSCARIFARAVNCEHPVNGSPCGECAACKALANENVDIIEMDAASNNGVDDARDIREKVKYLPVACRYKVYIIDEVHMLTGGAFNALLKTIEEPPEHVIFILATTEPQKLPQTILSRCIRFDFKLVPTAELAKHIAKIYKAEGIKYTDEAVEEIARLGEGSVRDALSIADMLASAAETVTPEVVIALTGAGDSAAVAELFDLTASRDLAGALGAVDRFAKNGKSMSAVAAQLTEYARNVLVMKSVGRDKSSACNLINTDRLSAERIAASADKFAMRDISAMLEGFGAAERDLRYSINPRVYLETSLVKMICAADRQDQLLKRIEALEKNSAIPAEQKKNKVEYAPNQTSVKSASMRDAENTLKPSAKIADPYMPTDMTEPEPPPEITDDYAVAEQPKAHKGRTEAEQTTQAFAATQEQPQAAPIVRKSTSRKEITAADEGEFMHKSAGSVQNLEFLGKIVTYLRKKRTPSSARALELLSRGVKVKERDDAIAFVAPDDCYLSVTDDSVIAEYNAALDSMNVKKRARAEKTQEDIIAEDIIRAKELFGRDGVINAIRPIGQ